MTKNTKRSKRKKQVKTKNNLNLIHHASCILSLWISTIHTTLSLNNGVALTPPMGFNSYMAGPKFQNEEGLLRVATFLLNSGMRAVGYQYINTDEGWENTTRRRQQQHNNNNNKHHPHFKSYPIEWNSTLYPSGMPHFIQQLHNLSFQFGIYGAASAVSCGTRPGQLHFEVVDIEAFYSWGVDFLKSDNCANYAMDSSVRFRAIRDAILNHPYASPCDESTYKTKYTHCNYPKKQSVDKKSMVLSIEPFSIHPDPLQSNQIANLWRTGVDIEGTWEAILDRANIADKWAPLAGPTLGWNDPDMIYVHNGLTLGENRVYFGLWAIMKAPLLLSTDLDALDPRILKIITNKEVIAINQDDLGIPARKVLIDGSTVPWKVGVEDCAFPHQSLRYSRRIAVDRKGNPLAGPGRTDTRQWKVLDVTADASTFQDKIGTHSIINRTIPLYLIRNQATGRCLTQSNATTAVLLPCSKSRPSQLWLFEKGISTVTSIINVEVGLALAISTTTLYAQFHGKDDFPVSDLAYGEGGLTLKPIPSDDNENSTCNSRWCENYYPELMWYYSQWEGTLRHALYTSSMNHVEPYDQEGPHGYILTPKVPTFRHHCLAHVLSTANSGTESGSSTEVWAGPLSGGDYVVALLNRGDFSATIAVPLDSLILSKPNQSFHRHPLSFVVRDAWNGKNKWIVRAGDEIKMDVQSHDVAILRLRAISDEPKMLNITRPTTFA